MHQKTQTGVDDEKKSRKPKKYRRGKIKKDVGQNGSLPHRGRALGEMNLSAKCGEKPKSAHANQGECKGASDGEPVNGDLDKFMRKVHLGKKMD